MGITIIQTKGSDSSQDLLDLKALKTKSNRAFAFKGLLAVAGIVIGVVALIFLSLQFAPFAIGLIILSGFMLHHLFLRCQISNRDYDHAAYAIAHHK